MIARESWYVEADERELARLERDALAGDPEAYVAYWRQLARMGYPQSKVTDELIEAIPKGALAPYDQVILDYWHFIEEQGLPEDRITPTLVYSTPKSSWAQILKGHVAWWGQEEWAVASDFPVDDVFALDWQVSENAEWENLREKSIGHPLPYLVSMLNKQKVPGGDVWSLSDDYPSTIENWGGVNWDEGGDPIVYYQTKYMIRVEGPHAQKLVDIAWKVFRG